MRKLDNLLMNVAESIETRLASVFRRITAAARLSGREPGDITLVTVTKTQPVEAVREAIAAGAAIIGENYIQEARNKFEALTGQQASWHLIGHLQSNKAKYAVRIFDLIHSVDSIKLAGEIDKQAQKAGKIQDILIQVNISGESSKSGVAHEAAMTLIKDMAALPNIRLKGLMTMPPFFNAPDRARPFFADLRRLRDRAEQATGIALPHLSMGMTGDFEAAIREGATLIRVGTAIFGERG